MNHFQPFDHETMDLAPSPQELRQAADFGGHDPQYHAALVVICEEQGAGRYARAINLVARIWGKTEHEVLVDAVTL